MLIGVNKSKSEDEIDEIRQAVRANKGYCPCKLEHIPDNKCICKDMRENHICECGLYIYKGE